MIGAVLRAGQTAAALGFNVVGQSGVATAVSELARNIVKYAGRGCLTVSPLGGPGPIGIEIVALDEGPGIEDVTRAMADHFSTGGTLGMGLPGVRRLMDEFTIDSAPGQGTRITARKWK